MGSAPDTFYDSAHQAARQALDSGAIGNPVFGQSFVGLPGLELFHPDPANFYKPGGEPPYDVGPYHILQWINLFGSVKRLYSSGRAGKTERTILRGPMQGTRFSVEVATTFNVILEFDAATVTLALSLDVAIPSLRPGEIFGSEGILTLADPILFSGSPILSKAGGPPEMLPVDAWPFGQPNRLNHAGQPVGDYRGVGLVDLALAVRTSTEHRTAPDLILHAVEVMEAIVQSAHQHDAIEIVTSCHRPRPINPVDDAHLIAMTPSPFDVTIPIVADRGTALL